MCKDEQTVREDEECDLRMRDIRAAEMADDDAYEQACREHIAGEAWDRTQADR